MIPIPKTSAHTVKPKEGSSLYYSLLYCREESRHRFLNVLTLINTLEHTLDGVREHHVAETKIHWWHEEIERLFGGNPRHPETRNCTDTLVNAKNAREQLMAVLSATANERLSESKTDAELQQCILDDFKARINLLGHALQSPNPANAHSLALGLGLHHRLIRLPQLMQHGLELFSAETYRRFNLQPNDILEGKGQALLLGEIERAGNQLKSGIAAYPRGDTLLLPIITLARLRERQLRLWQKRPPNLAHESITLTPLRKFVTTWRTRRIYG